MILQDQVLISQYKSVERLVLKLSWLLVISPQQLQLLLTKLTSLRNLISSTSLLLSKEWTTNKHGKSRKLL